MFVSGYADVYLALVFVQKVMHGLHTVIRSAIINQDTLHTGGICLCSN